MEALPLGLQQTPCTPLDPLSSDLEGEGGEEGWEGTGACAGEVPRRPR